MSESNWKLNWTDMFRLAPGLPEFADPEDQKYWGKLEDLASDVIAASARLEGAVAPKTAIIVGDKIRLLNGLYSNLIEGHEAFIPEIERALEGVFSEDAAAQFSQELCAAHVKTEKYLTQMVLDQPDGNVSHLDFVTHIHKSFFSRILPEHQFTHEGKGFTKNSVTPGILRDSIVGIRGSFGTMQIGPDPEDLAGCMHAFGEIFDPLCFHGDKLPLAAAAGHLKLAWLHPFRDGNGRTVRLYTGLFLASCGINRSSLWSLSRGFSRDRRAYMSGLMVGDPQPCNGDRNKIEFMDENVAMFCEHFLETCKQQIEFMSQQLNPNGAIKDRISSYVAKLCPEDSHLQMKITQLLWAVFRDGQIQRAEAYGILDSSRWGRKTSQRLISRLLKEGLLETQSSRAPLTVGLPTHVLPQYFPSLFDHWVMGRVFPTRVDIFSS